MNIEKFDAGLKLLADHANDETILFEESIHRGLEHARNAGEALALAREMLKKQTYGSFGAWMRENYKRSRETAYGFIRIFEQWEEVERLCNALHNLGHTISLRKILGLLRTETPPITAIQTPESPTSVEKRVCLWCGESASGFHDAQGDWVCNRCSSEGKATQLVLDKKPESQSNAGPAVDAGSGAGGSPVYSKAEQAIMDRLLKPGEMAAFESGVDHNYDEHQCYLCNDYFFVDQMKSLQGNRYCYSCRQQLPDSQPVAESDAAPLYDTTLFDEPPPAIVDRPDTTLLETNGQVPAMVVKDPYDEMLDLADELFPMLSAMQDVRTCGIYGPLRRFIELFREIHQLKST